LREEFIYLAVIMDVFTRIMRGWRLGLGLGVELTLGAAGNWRSVKSTPEIHHSDQGLQYAATDYTARLQSVGAQISMAEVGQSAPQRYAERVIRTIKEEEVYLNDYRDLADARSRYATSSVIRCVTASDHQIDHQPFESRSSRNFRAFGQ